jgi:hypothetical protein
MSRSIDCRRFAALAEREASGLATRREFRSLDRHRDACAACAARLREAGPLAAFAALAAAGREPSAGLWEGIRAGIHEEGRLGLAEGVALMRPSVRTALAAALFVALALLALAAPRLVPRPAPAPAPPERAAAPPAPETRRPTVESIESPDARVYEVKVFGEGDRFTDVVLIVDRGVDL